MRKIQTTGRRKEKLRGPDEEYKKIDVGREEMLLFLYTLIFPCD